MSDERVPDVAAVQSPPRRKLNYEQLSPDEEPIGGGGQGIVYRTDVPGCEPPHQLAIKEPAVDNRTLDRTDIDAFLKEAGTWETVDRQEREKPRWSDSEHIVGVVDSGDNLPWIALEYMDGGGLDDRLEAHPDGLPVEEALWIGECVCRGVELAHNYGIAHLDLKPANVLFQQTPDDVWDVPKIADWGLSRVLAEQTGTMSGLSVKYAAPEQFEPEEFGDPDMLTDVYQIGVLVYAMLTGRPPYTGSQLSVMRDVVSDEPTPPSAVRGGLPDAVDETVLLALATEKTTRYPNVKTLEQALQAIRTGQRLPRTVTRRVDNRETVLQTDGSKIGGNNDENNQYSRAKSNSVDQDTKSETGTDDIDLLQLATTPVLRGDAELIGNGIDGTITWVDYSDGLGTVDSDRLIYDKSRDEPFPDQVIFHIVPAIDPEVTTGDADHNSIASKGQNVKFDLVERMGEVHVANLRSD